MQTVYYTFGTKGRLLTEVVEVTAARKDERVPPMKRAWAREMLSTRSAQRAHALAVEHGTAIYDRVANLWLVVNAAAALDADVAIYWRGVNAGRRDGLAALVAHLRGLNSLRQDLSDRKAADILVLLAGHVAYSGLVVDAGWSFQRVQGVALRDTEGAVVVTVSCSPSDWALSVTVSGGSR